MYQHPGQQQSPQQHQQHQHQQHQQQQHQQHQHPQHQQYPPPPNSQAGQPYSSQISPNRPEMATIHPQFQQQQSYQDQMPRLPAPPHQQYYAQHPQPNLQPNFQQPSPQQQSQQNNQAAPRQRTAIACKYCRRRKIRCSGFENAADGRCANCIRFNQQCVFTPVSSQTQAFVPAQAVYGRGGGQQGPPPQLYGPYGQPLPRQPEGYPPQQYPMHSPGHPGAPPMQHPYPPQGYPGHQYAPQGYPPQQYEQQPPATGGPPPPHSSSGSRRRRDEDEPHTPTLPPPNPGPQSQLANHEQQQPYGYPDQAGYAGSPAPSQGSYHGAPQAYYPAQPQRSSPGSGYPYEQTRGSNSPHNNQAYYGQGPPPQQSGQAVATQPGRTPPPHPDGRNGLAIRDIVSGDAATQGERTAADSDMVSALNRTSRR